jgi:hypothetical protein
VQSSSVIIIRRNIRVEKGLQAALKLAMRVVSAGPALPLSLLLLLLLLRHPSQ